MMPWMGGGPPTGGLRTGPASCLLEPGADLTQAQPVGTNPGEDQANKARLLGYDLEPSDPAPSLAGDIAVPERRAGEGAD